MQWTGLPEKKAVQAADRHFSEPIRWHGSPERSNSFKNILQNKGARILQGGRFMHVAGNSGQGQSHELVEQLLLPTPGLEATRNDPGYR